MEPDAPDPAPIRRRVLVVDDDAPMRDALLRFLRRSFPDDIIVEQAPEAATALELLSKGAGRDLVLTDAHMPGMTGIELAGRIRRAHPETPVIVMTGRSERFSLEDAAAAGAAGYLEKPVPPDHLREVVRAALGMRLGFDGTVRELSVSDLTQLVCLTGQPAAVRVTATRGRSGAFFVEAGNVVDATSGRLRGQMAFCEIVTWEQGRFRILPGARTGHQTINIPWAALLLEAVRRQDERAARITPIDSAREQATSEDPDVAFRKEACARILSSGAFREVLVVRAEAAATSGIGAAPLRVVAEAAAISPNGYATLSWGPSTCRYYGILVACGVNADECWVVAGHLGAGRHPKRELACAADKVRALAEQPVQYVAA